MIWTKRILLAFAAMAALTAALPLFISLDDYLPRIEEAVSTSLKQPVSIRRISFAVLPFPHLTISDIRIGKTDDLKLGRVSVTPDLFSLLQSTRVIRSVEIESPVVTRNAIDMMAAWARTDPGKPSQPLAVRVNNIRLENVVVRLEKTDFGPFDAGVRINSKGEAEEASITTRDDKLKVLIKPDQANYLIDVRATAWALPAGPALVFDELHIKGVATQNDARLDEVSARLYGGNVLGTMNLGWQKGLRIDGNLDISDLELRQFAAILTPGTRVSGKLTARPVFSAAAATADQLAKALRLETDFKVRDGVLHGVDIQQAATRLIKQGTSGGETRFDQLSGYLAVVQGSHHFTRLRIASGVLAADGTVSVTPRKALSGRVNAQVKLAGVGANVPLNVGGTVSAPLLFPTTGTIAGAAAGTAIMGPGFGTSIGAKVGGWVENLFEAKPQKTPDR